MKSNFERNKFIRDYWITVLILFVIMGGYLCLSWERWDGRIFVLAGILLIGFVILFAVIFRHLNSVYRDIEEISQSMNDMSGSRDEPPEEIYREGAVGILYSNYYKMVRALQESRNREKDEKIFLRDIISDISHQLKTPLASLHIFMELLLDDKVEEREKRRQILTEAQNQLDRMEWMVLSMLKLARIEAGAIQFEKKETFLLPLLKEAADSVRLLAEKKHQHIVIDCPEEIQLNCDGLADGSDHQSAKECI